MDFMTSIMAPIPLLSCPKPSPRTLPSQDCWGPYEPACCLHIPWFTNASLSDQRRAFSCQRLCIMALNASGGSLCGLNEEVGGGVVSCPSRGRCAGRHALRRASSRADSLQKGLIFGPSETGGPAGRTKAPCSGWMSSNAFCPDSGVRALEFSDMAKKALSWAHNPQIRKKESRLFPRTTKGLTKVATVPTSSSKHFKQPQVGDSL